MDMDIKTKLYSRAISDDGCLLWTGGTSAGSDGLGRWGTVYTTGSQAHYVHRLSYQLSVGDIPKNYVIKHTCGRRLCINPDHLEAITKSTKNYRSKRTEKSHCPQGHVYDEDNTTYDGKGARRCRACRRAQNNAYKSRNK